MLVHRADARGDRRAASVQGVRRGVPRCDAGPADAESVRPEGARTAAKLANKARALSDSTFWVLARRASSPASSPISAWHWGRPLPSPWVPGGDSGRDGHGGAAGRADGRHGNFRPLRDLRRVLHQGMIGQSAAGASGAAERGRPRRRADDAPPGRTHAEDRLRSCRIRLPGLRATPIDGAELLGRAR